MANKVYPKAKEKLGKAEINWPADTVKAYLIDTADYTVNFATHEFLSDIPSGARVAVSPDITGKTCTNGVFDCDNFTFPTVTGDQAEAIVFVKVTGTESTSPLISYHDTASVLPVTPNGLDIPVTIDNGPNKLFAL